MLERPLAFVLATAALYLGIVAASSRIRVGDRALIQHIAHNPLEPGGDYHSLRRFREAAATGPVDIVFLGSSHAYRGFDPRLFDDVGKTSFNLGSTNQTPLNSYYLAKRHLPAMSPELCVVEVYYGALEHDGLESFRDLAVNTRYSTEILTMAVATRQLDAIELSIAKGFGWAADESGAVQRSIDGERYVDGGYVETERTRDRLATVTPRRVEWLDRQLDYLEDLTDFARERGARTIWVAHPLPSDHRASLENEAEVRAAVSEAASAAGTDFWDYGERLPLDPLEHFSDFHHLNAAGVERFNQALIADLRAAGYL